MYLHANAKLGLAGRLALVRAIEDGLSLKAVAVAFNVSPVVAGMAALECVHDPSDPSCSCTAATLSGVKRAGATS